MRSLIMTGFCFACVASVSPAIADPQQPFPAVANANGSQGLAGLIEASLQQMTSACTNQAGPLRLARWGSNTLKEATAVPVAMQQALQLNGPTRWVRPEYGESVERIFETVYTGNSATAPEAIVSQLSLPDQTAATPLPGMNLVAYESDCNSSLSAALNSDVNFTLPVATLKAALSGSYQNTGRYRLSFVGGRFVSPLRRTLSGQQAGASPLPLFPTALAIWLWYRDNPVRLSQSHWIVDSFDGFALFTQQDSRINGQITANGTGSGRVLGVGGDANAQTSAFVTSTLAARLYAVIYDIDASAGIKRTHYPLPTAARAAEVAAAHGEMVLDRENFSGSELLDDRLVRMRHVMAGLPQAECSPSLWKVSGATDVQLDSVLFEPKVSGCAFGTSYKPGAALVRDGGDLQFSLVRPFGTPTGPDLALRVPTLHFTPSRAPALRLGSGSPSPVAAAVDPVGLTTLTWTRQYSLVDRAAPQSVVAIEAEDMRIFCGSRSQPVTATATITSGAGADRSVALTVQGATPLPVNATTLYESCETRGDLVYVLQNGDRVRKAFPPVHVVYVPRPPEPAVQAAETSDPV